MGHGPAMAALAAVAGPFVCPDRAALANPGEPSPAEAVPAETLPTETLPTETLPTETLPTETLPTETLPLRPIQVGPTGLRPHPGKGSAVVDPGKGSAMIGRCDTHRFRRARWHRHGGGFASPE